MHYINGNDYRGHVEQHQYKCGHLQQPIIRDGMRRHSRHSYGHLHTWHRLPRNSNGNGERAAIPCCRHIEHMRRVNNSIKRRYDGRHVGQQQYIRSYSNCSNRSSLWDHVRYHYDYL